MVDLVTLQAAQLAVVSHKKAADVAVPQPNAARTAQPAAQNISLAKALAQQGPAFDAERVAALRAAIAAGEYHIDLGAIADGMMRFGTGTAARPHD